MMLSEYLEKENISALQFAERLGITRSAVYNYCMRIRSPKYEIAKLIEKETGGCVSLDDLMIIKDREKCKHCGK